MTPLNRFIASCGLTNMGDGIALIAWTWVASQLTRDPLLIALVPASLKAPWFLFSLPAGIVVDRVDRRRLILVADALRAVAYGVAAVVIWAALPFDTPPLRGTDRPAVMALLGLAALSVGLAEVVRDNAAQTMMPALVPPGALERANGRLWSVEMVSNAFVGTALAGVLLGVSLALPFVVNAGAMMLAVMLVLRLRGDFGVTGEGAGDGGGDGAAAAPTRNWRAELRQGIAFLLGQPVLRQLALVTGLYNFAFEAMMVTLVLVVQERLQFGPLGLSAVMASGAVGGIGAGLVNDRFVARLGRAGCLRVGMLTGLAFPVAAVFAGPGAAGLVLICAAFLVSEFGGVLWNTVSVSFRQRAVPRALLGRVNATYRLFAVGMAPLGMVCAGLLTRAVAPVAGRDAALSAPFVLALAVYVVLAVGWWRFVGRSFAATPAGPAPQAAGG